MARNRKMVVVALGLVCAILPAAIPSQALAADFVCPPCGSACDSVRYAAPGKCESCGMKLMALEKTLHVAIVLYNGVELLDFAGPGEVFQAAGGFTNEGDGGVSSFTVSVDGEPIISQGFVTIDPEYSIVDCPQPDIIVFPGGRSSSVTNDSAMMAWVRQAAPRTRRCMSVCTGAFILASAGFLDGLEATTWYGAIDRFRERYPKVKVQDNVRWIDNGRYVTTAGVSAGIDGALHVVAQVFGQEVAERTARYMEYDKWDPESGVRTKSASQTGGS